MMMDIDDETLEAIIETIYDLMSDDCREYFNKLIGVNESEDEEDDERRNESVFK